MSRNSNRTKVNHQAMPPAPQMPNTPPTEKPNPFGISFVVPTETVYLPSGGEFYEEGSPLVGVKTLEIKAMTSKEEDIIMNSSYVDDGTVFDRLIDSLMVTEGVKAQDILDCDKMALLFSARKTGYGDSIDLLMTCKNCGTDQERDIKISDFLDKFKEETFSIRGTEEFVYDETSKTALIELPVSKIKARIRSLLPSDYKYLEEAKAQKQKLNLPFSETIEFLRRVIVEANGVTTQTELFQLVEYLPSADARKIKEVHNRTIPIMDRTFDIECSNCGHAQKEVVPFTLGMFWN